MHNNPHVLQLHDIDHIEETQYEEAEEAITLTLKLVLREPKKLPIIALHSDAVAPYYIPVKVVALPGNTEKQEAATITEAIISTETPEQQQARKSKKSGVVPVE